MEKLSLDDLVYAIPKAWNAETLGNEKRVGDHPAAGQCVVSSLLVQRHHGGIIIRCEVGGESWNRVRHYFNELEGGVTIDTTRAQFGGNGWRKPHRLFLKNPPTKTYIFDDTWHRVEILEERVREVLSWR